MGFLNNLVSKKTLIHGGVSGLGVTLYSYYVEGNPVKKSLYTGAIMSGSVIVVDKLLTFLWDDSVVDIDFGSLSDTSKDTKLILGFAANGFVFRYLYGMVMRNT